MTVPSSSPVPVPLVRRLARWRVPAGFVSAIAVFWLARPSWTSLGWGLVVALVGEAIRVWAAGHLEKGREVTKSGPYRLVRHPLYVGSSVMGAGVAVASRSGWVAALVAAYFLVTISLAVRSEESTLRERFGEAYDRYAAGETSDAVRRFSLERALRNKEYRAALGLLAGFGLLAMKIGVG